MTQLTALKELAEKVEAGTAPDYSMFRRGVRDWDGVGGGVNRDHAWRAYTGSLDAAKALHEAVLPGWGATVCLWPMDNEWQVAVHSEDLQSGHEEADETNPARAWLLAIIRAKISELES